MKKKEKKKRRKAKKVKSRNPNGHQGSPAWCMAETMLRWNSVGGDERRGLGSWVEENEEKRRKGYKRGKERDDDEEEL